MRTAGAGLPAGTEMPIHDDTLRFATPCSANVGMSVSVAERLGAVMPSAFSRPVEV